MSKTDKMLSIKKERLLYARNYYGLSLDSVASETNISFFKLNGFELGTHHPSYSQLTTLANYYNRPLLFFFLRNDPPLEEKLVGAFRHIEKDNDTLLNRKIKMMLEQADTYRYNLLELYDGQITPCFREKLDNDNVKSDEEFNNWLRKNLDLSLQKQKNNYMKAEELIEYIRNMLYDIGIYIFKDSFKADNVSGLCLYDDKFPIILLNNKTTFNRQLFTIFHELYHLFCKESNVFFDVDGLEHACDKFASEFLIPKLDFENKIITMNYCEDINFITDLAKEYTVSREAIAYRLLKLRKISSDFYISIREGSLRKYNAANSGGNFYYTRMSYLGKSYLKQIFSSYYSNKISIIDVSRYTGLKVVHVTRLSTAYYGGEF